MILILMVEGARAVISFCAHSSEHGVTTMGLGDVVNQFHDEYGLAHTGTTEQTDLSSLGVGGEEVNNLDTSHKNLLLDAHLVELGRLGVNGLPLVGGDRTSLVNWVSHDVDDPAQGLGADRDHDGGAGVVEHLPADKTLGTVHGNGSDALVNWVS